MKLLLSDLCFCLKHIHAADIYTRMNDVKSLVDLHVEACHWEEAFSLVEEHPQFKVRKKFGSEINVHKQQLRTH